MILTVGQVGEGGDGAGPLARVRSRLCGVRARVCVGGVVMGLYRIAGRTCWWTVGRSIGGRSEKVCMHVCVYAYVCLCAHGRYFLAVDVGVTRAVLAHAVAAETLETVCAYICVYLCVW